MEPSLMVVGLNYRTAPLAVRERFWIEENRRHDALLKLSGAEGIEEVILLCTCNRTEFWLWTSDVTLAANSVMRLLAEYGLMLCEWKHFYRLLDETALLHIFRVACCLDSMVLGAPQVVPQVSEAWCQAQKSRATGRFLDAVVQKALAISEGVRNETAIGKMSVSIPSTAVELVCQVFDTLENKKILLLGAGEMCELAGRGLLSQGAKPSHMGVANRTFEHGSKLAAQLGATAIHFEERLEHMAKADIVITSTACPHTIFNCEEVETVLTRRKNRPLLIVDLAVPRNVAPAVRNLKGVVLYDLDDLEAVMDGSAKEREAAAAAANKILLEQAQGFRCKLMEECVTSSTAALRSRLDEFCRQELEAFRNEQGGLSKDQDEMLTAVMSRMTQRMAGTLARELKERPQNELDLLSIALHRLLPACNAPSGACQHQVSAGNTASRTV